MGEMWAVLAILIIKLLIFLASIYAIYRGYHYIKDELLPKDDVDIE